MESNKSPSDAPEVHSDGYFGSDRRATADAHPPADAAPPEMTEEMTEEMMEAAWKRGFNAGVRAEGDYDKLFPSSPRGPWEIASTGDQDEFLVTSKSGFIGPFSWKQAVAHRDILNQLKQEKK